MILCGLDIASTTGAAVKEPGKKIWTQVFRASAKAVKKKGAETAEDVFGEDNKSKIDAIREGQIGRAFEDWLMGFLIEHRIQCVAVEEVLISNPTRKKTVVNLQAEFAGQALKKFEVKATDQPTIYRIYGLNFLAVSVCSRLGIPCYSVNQSKWRKAFLGNGRPKDSKKESMAMCKRLAIPVVNADAAEAVGVVSWLDGFLNPYGTGRPGDLFGIPPAGEHGNR